MYPIFEQSVEQGVGEDQSTEPRAATESTPEPPHSSSSRVRKRKRPTRRSTRHEPSPSKDQEHSVEDNVGEESDGFSSVHSSGEEEEGARRRWFEFNPEVNMRDPKFEECMLFATTDILKKAVKQYAILNKVNVGFVRNNKERVNVECKNCDGWALRASLNKKLNAIYVKQYKNQHTCGKEMPSRYIIRKW